MCVPGPSVVLVGNWWLWFSEAQEVVRDMWLVKNRSALRPALPLSPRLLVKLTLPVGKAPVPRE